MDNQKRLFIAGLFFFVIMSISGIYALTESIDNTDSPVSTSFVDIGLSDNSSTIKVMPGDNVLLDTMINNFGIDCYVRAKVSYKVKNVNLSVDDYVNIDNSKWQKIGDYYYYNSILMENESIKLISDFDVPSSLNNSYSSKNLIVEVVAEAIQARNVNIDYSSERPWGDIPVTEKIDRTYSTNQINSSIIYENGADRYLTISRSFFSRLNDLVPGDVITEYIDVVNIEKDNVDLYFSLSSENMNSYEKRFFESINLLIEDENGKILYDGAMLDYDTHFLKSYSKNSSGKLKLTVSVPLNLDNDYSLILTDVIWKFSTDLTEEVPTNPKTGEEKLNLSIKVFILSFIGLLVVLILAKLNTIDRNKKEGR